MKRRNIPFLPEFRDRMLSGRKTWTTRSRAYGEPGDTFEAFGEVFELVAVTELPLGMVAAHGHKREGFETAAEFIECWNRIHPRRPYSPSAVKTVHQFRLAEGGMPDGRRGH